MHGIHQARRATKVAAAALAITLAAPWTCAQTLPAMPSTSLAVSSPQQAPMAGAPVADERSKRPHTADITYAEGQLDIRANDSSLNQILRGVARKTGLKITGGVQDERVFGHYGPAPLASVLTTLLDGTGTNLLLHGGDTTHPPELVLTQRGGGATPPSPGSAAYAADDEAEASAGRPQQAAPGAAQTSAPQKPVGTGPASVAQPQNNVNGSPANASPTASTMPTTHSVPIDSVPTPSTTPSTTGIVDSPNPPAPGSTTGTAPNGTLTPEQVAQRLLELQKQKQQQQSTQTPGSSTPQR